ncbi:LexA-binding, inner membrane-associated putative hydrolase [Paenibacillus cellulosilyticus]|uniref:LexA-binding, inner membrane-associated putative hydrolase n=1 Tax=Paenibacillus cellulosilyticus TaxID=375489 RepID=A0A2V2YW90_9BACL|nr:metal-dependent hydrolase [Paenibacillus cellulosilyticus]PWW01204.1 LexA-binding, inner membrane-associated putative hydrolase [Paenibacillus cellulosilyticus]QKS46841.1 metal-dependent hydrolase [Paenibacillus cellulosilyticus]
MNKKGHIALGAAAGSAMLLTGLFVVPRTMDLDGWIPIAIYAAAVITGSLLPDIDHKTGTVSNYIQFSSRKRRMLRSLTLIGLVIGITLLLLTRWTEIDIPSAWRQSPPLWIGTGLLCLALSRLRSLVLIGAGVLLLLAYYLYNWHWIAAFAGLSLLMVPLIKHRGVIHTPEFAAALSVGVWSFAQAQPEVVTAGIYGLLIGWWAHLLGDVFGAEGIHSLFIPRFRVALRLFANGSWAERMITRSCWLISAGCLLFTQQERLLYIDGLHYPSLQHLLLLS